MALMIQMTQTIPTEDLEDVVVIMITMVEDHLEEEMEVMVIQITVQVGHLMELHLLPVKMEEERDVMQSLKLQDTHSFKPSEKQQELGMKLREEHQAWGKSSFCKKLSKMSNVKLKMPKRKI